MFWSIKRELKQLSRQAEPRPEFQRALRKEFVTPRPWFMAMIKPVVASASIVTMLGAGTATYAYTSDDVVPDHPLYPIREQVERAEEAIARTPEQRAAVQLKRVQRRVHELEMMAVKRKVIQRPHMEKFTAEFDHAITAGEPLQNGERVRFDDALSAVEDTQTKLLERVRDRISDEQKRKEVEELINTETEKVTKRIELLHEKRRARFEMQLRRRVQDKPLDAIRPATGTRPILRRIAPTTTTAPVVPVRQIQIQPVVRPLLRQPTDLQP